MTKKKTAHGFTEMLGDILAGLEAWADTGELAAMDIFGKVSLIASQETREPHRRRGTEPLPPLSPKSFWDEVGRVARLRDHAASQLLDAVTSRRKRDLGKLTSAVGCLAKAYREAWDTSAGKTIDGEWIP